MTAGRKRKESAASDETAGERRNIVFVGHVDHGKSSILGRLLAETDSVPAEKIASVREFCERNSRPFEFAFLLDTLRDERAQGITIDTAQIVFRRGGREFSLADAPGHLDFLKNMATGASQADAAFLVVDASEGFQANSRCHLQLLSLLGLQSVSLLVNKMDLVDYREEIFRNIENEYNDLVRQFGLRSHAAIPLSAVCGEGIVKSSKALAWYAGPPLLTAMETLPPPEQTTAAPFRLFVQDVYKFTKRRDYRRIVAGTIESGSFSVGDTILFSPSGKRTMVQRIETSDPEMPPTAGAGQAVGFTLAEPLFVTRGQLVSRADESPPQVATSVEAEVFWLDNKELQPGEPIVLQLGTSRISARIEHYREVIRMADGLKYEEPTLLTRGDLARCVLTLKSPLAFDEPALSPATSRFALVRDHGICGGGRVLGALSQITPWVRDSLSVRHKKWENSMIAREYRAQRFGQKAAMILITGPTASERKQLAKVVEAKLFSDGRAVYFLGFRNMLYGLSADLENNPENNAEHVRRLGEMANILLDAGLILLVSVADFRQKDVELLKRVVDFQELLVVWYGDLGDSDLRPDLLLAEGEDLAAGVESIRLLLEQQKIIFCPW
jgi:bifunctional enzyme CysN/CysC